MAYQNYIFDLYGTLVDIRTDEGDIRVWEKLSLFYGYYGARYVPMELRAMYRRLTQVLAPGRGAGAAAQAQNIISGAGGAAPAGKGSVSGPGAGAVAPSGKGSVSGPGAGDAATAGKGSVSGAGASGAAPSRQDNGRGESLYSHEAYPEIQIEKVFRALFTAKGVEPEEALVLHAGQFFRALTTDYVRLYDGAAELLAELRRLGKGVYLLSNAQRIFTERELAMLGILDSFHGVLISSDWGVKKPSPEFFGKLWEQYGLKPEECLMIGNDAESDIAGARQAGMDTCYIHSNISPDLKEPVDATYVVMEMDLGKARELIL